MQLTSFIVSVMTLCMFVYQKILCVYVLEKVKTILYIYIYILVIHQQWLMKSIFVENGHILGKSTKGA